MGSSENRPPPPKPSTTDDPAPPSPVEAFGTDDVSGEFDPDRALAEVRAREAMEELRARERAGPIRAAAADAPSLGPSAIVPGDALPEAEWPDTDLPTELRASGDGAPPVPRADVDPEDPRFETPEDPRIPAAQDSFRIGEAARIVGVKPHVLRFWETEFDEVTPQKTTSNQRRYRREDVARLLRIRRLRHEAHLTVAQTRAALDTGIPTPMFDASEVPPERVPQLRRRLAEVRRLAVELIELVETEGSASR